MSSNTCVIVSAMFMQYGGVTVIVSREILTNKTPAEAFTPPADEK